MDPHIIYCLAQIIGVYLFVFGASMLMVPEKVRPVMKDFVQSKMLVLFTGYLSVLVGMIIITMYNVWIWHWAVLITIVGWFFLLNGLARIFLMDKFMKEMKSILSGDKYYWMGWILLIVGAYLGSMGFFG